MKLKFKDMAADFVAKLMAVVLTWAGVWPLVYFFAPKIIGVEYADQLKTNIVFVYYAAVALVTIIILRTMKPFFRSIMDSLVAMASPYGVINKDNTNVAIVDKSRDVKSAFYNTAFTIAKWQVIAFLALTTLNTELEKAIERSQVKSQKIQIHNLEKRIQKLESLR